MNANEVILNADELLRRAERAEQEAAEYRREAVHTQYDEDVKYWKTLANECDDQAISLRRMANICNKRYR